MSRRVIRHGIIFMLAVSMAGLTLVIPTLSKGTSVPQARTVDFVYHFTIEDIPPGAERIVAWIPIPTSNAYQHLEDFRVEGDWPHEILTDSLYGNRCIRFDLSHRIKDLKSHGIRATFRVRREACQTLQKSAILHDVSQDVRLDRFLAADRLVPIDGQIAEEAKQVVGDVRDPLLQARRLYDNIVDSVSYEKTGKGWGRGDALYACDIRKGNCTDFHSLFIGEARSLGIPARFVMGVPLPENRTGGEMLGYHCWAEFYIESRGWIPLDASEASKFPKRKEELFGGLDINRIQFTIGRDIPLPLSDMTPLNYFIYPHVEIDGKTHAEVQNTFSFRAVEHQKALPSL